MRRARSACGLLPAPADETRSGPSGWETELRVIGSKSWGWLCTEQFVYFAYLPDSKRRRPAPVSARADMIPKWGNTSRTYPAAISRSRCASGIVTCIGLLATCFSEANSSLVSRLLCRDKDRVWRRRGVIANQGKESATLMHPFYTSATFTVDALNRLPLRTISWR